MSLAEELAAKLGALVADAQARLKDGVQAEDVFRTLADAVSLGVRVAQDFADVPGAEKRQAVTESVLAFYDAVIQPLDIPWVPDMIADPLLRSVVEPLIGALIESLVALFRAKGWLAA